LINRAVEPCDGVLIVLTSSLKITLGQTDFKDLLSKIYSQNDEEQAGAIPEIDGTRRETFNGRDRILADAWDKMLGTNNLGHLGIILDGNRRWAKTNGLNPWQGYWAGANKAEEFLDWCLELGIPEVSMYVLSSENFEKRSKKELREIFKVLLEKTQKLMNDEKIPKYEVKVKFCGSFHELPSGLVRAFQKLMRRARNYQKMVLNVLVNYGSQGELRKAIAKAIRSAIGKKIRITPKVIQKNLMVGKPLDLIIRTGGDHRLSNFLLWQAAYAEIYFTDTLWPDFSKREFLNIIEWFNHRQRRFGE